MNDFVNLLNSTFKSFNIKAECVDSFSHRHFIFFDVKLAPGTKVSRILSFSNELALAMRIKSSFIIKPIPELGIVRLQSTFKNADKLLFSDLYKSPPNKSYLPFMFGETDEGQPLWVDMSKNPHLLIAGATGSGKSVLLHTLIANAAKRRDTNLYLIDTKKVEFNIYRNKNMRRLIINQANDYNSALDLLHYCYDEMEQRYEYMADNGISSSEQEPNLTKNLIIIDEASDLILFDKKNKQFENILVRLAQKARAAGTFIALATQRPSVDVITGLIKANFPARLSCKVSSRFDSKVVLDQQGAENLNGKGDALFYSPNSKQVRLQIAYVDPIETVKNYA
jgi:S-DNA-T family DNA segregation ATPase FtsK/SpoIIIE